MGLHLAGLLNKPLSDCKILRKLHTNDKQGVQQLGKDLMGLCRHRGG